MNTTVLGYPRIGVNRELKRATEAYWAGTADDDELDRVATALRRRTWRTLKGAGLGSIPSNTFSLYDHVLDTAMLFGVVPDRFAGLSEREAYFAMARGAEGVPPLEMTKWFDTNYHYLVPELGPGTRPHLAGDKPFEEYREARSLGIETRPVLLGPLSFLLLSKPDRPGFAPLDLLDPLLDGYAELLSRLMRGGASWVQLDEPVLTGDRTPAELTALRHAYERLGRLTRRPRLMVATYFGGLDEALPVLADVPVEALAMDFVAGPGNREALAAIGGIGDKTLVAGVVDGRNVWRTDLPAALSTCASLAGLAAEVVVSTSCSLLHVPLDLSVETSLDAELRDRLAFARQKVAEVVLLGRALREGRDAIGDPPAPADAPVDERVRARVDALGTGAPRCDLASRRAAQAGLPVLPTTTIGSFPQTSSLRKARADHRAGRIDDIAYHSAMCAEIDWVIALQEDIGLDVLVHGEPERNDMVEYFAECLDGFATTEHGWVQSYGSRYVRPPIVHGDVSRPEPITVQWTTYAQSRTTKPVKGMLTGPVTMLAWSFVRTDQHLCDTVRQVALALRDEIHDLEASGIRVIQVDEPALRELLPSRRADRRAYLDWAVAAFRFATSGAAASTQIHTHMCYAEFGEIIDAIGELDADVTSVEAARSRMELLTDLARAGYLRDIGPGVYDSHSARVPTVQEMERSLRRAAAAVDPRHLWVNPDCGLKTRSYSEIEPALRNMTAAARRVRETL